MFLLDLLLPQRCTGCDLIVDADELLCEECLQQINFCNEDFDSHNKLYRRLQLLFPLRNAFSLMEFEKESLSRKIIHELKYNSRERHGKFFAEWTSERLQFDEREKPTVIVGVPLHPKKKRKRGYNQLDLFNQILGERMKIPVDKEALIRTNFRRSQASKNKARREKTDQGFRLVKPLTHTHFLLTDDVCTTGNTLASCAWELLKEPSNSVSILTIAHES